MRCILLTQRLFPNSFVLHPCIWIRIVPSSLDYPSRQMKHSLAPLEWFYPGFFVPCHPRIISLLPKPLNDMGPHKLNATCSWAISFRISNLIHMPIFFSDHIPLLKCLPLAEINWPYSHIFPNLQINTPTCFLFCHHSPKIGAFFLHRDIHSHYLWTKYSTTVLPLLLIYFAFIHGKT